MTGRDLILYILQNHLEDEPITLDGGFLNLIHESEAAVIFNVGIPTVRAWYDLKLIDGIKVADEVYMLPIKRDIKK